MKLKSAAGSVCYVKHLAKTVEFYEKVGFQFKTKDPDRASVYLQLVVVRIFCPAAAESHLCMARGANGQQRWLSYI